MPFTKRCNELNNFQNALSVLERPSHLQILVRDALDTIRQDCRLFDTCISCDSPFFKEFFNCIDLQDLTKIDDESCFSLFECLCIFFREKRLRFGASRLTESENNVLNYFENSGHWDQSDNTIVGNWYWNALPKKIMCECSEAHAK